MKSLVSLSLLAVFALSYSAEAASVEGRAVVKIQTKLRATKTHDLDFGVATQGDAILDVAPQDPNAAEFEVSGQENRIYSITVPVTTTTMFLIEGNAPASGPNKEIAVTNLRSEKVTGTLVGGVDEFHVGGQRAAITEGQFAGDYVGTFTVDLNYNP